MKRFFSLIISAGFVLTFHQGFSQYVPGALGYQQQALMFSKYNYTGSARIQGLGNTQVSLGGDASLALSNPGGLGFYNRSELSITPSYNALNTSADYIGTSTSSSLGKFNIDNFGAVFNKTKDDAIPGAWRGGSFAITFSKVNEFNSEINYSGSNTNNDILDFYVQDANNQNVDFDQLSGVTYGAFQTYLMSEFVDAFVGNTDTTYVPFYDRTFFSEFPTDQYPTMQQEVISSSGSQNQWSFSYGGNYNDFLYLGATLGIQSVRYNISKRYTETYPGLENDIVQNSELFEDLVTEGIGVNGTFGAIVRPINIMTIGVSVITPTFISIDERYFYRTFGNFNNFSMVNYGDYFDANYEIIVNPDADFTTFFESSDVLNIEDYDEESLFDYTITTPTRLNAGMTFFIKKNGFITADIEYVDYSNIKIKDDRGILQEQNESISSLYTSVVNLRVGAEWRLKAFRLRAGYNNQPSPYANSEIGSAIQGYSAGLGFRSSKFFADLAATYRTWNHSYAPYVLDNPNNESYLQTSFADIENEDLNIALSLGIFF